MVDGGRLVRAAHPHPERGGTREDTAHFDVTDSVALATGGGTGIRGAVTAAVLQAGASVAITGRDHRPRCATTVDEFPHLAQAVLPHLAASGGNLVEDTEAAVTNVVRSLALD